MLTLTEKTKECEKLRSENFEKKLKEKQQTPHQYERISSHLQEINSKLPILLNYLSLFLESDSHRESKNLEEMITPQKSNDVELLKYEEKIIKNEAELDLAKKSLMMYINHVKDLEEHIELMNNESNEKIFTQQDILDLRLENTKLKEENKYLFELNQKLEENIMASLKKYSRKGSKDFVEESNINSNTLMNNSKIINSTEKNAVKNSKINIDRGMDFKRICKQMLESLQIVQKNFNNFSAFEEEVVKSLQHTIKIYENRIIQYEKADKNSIYSSINM